MKLTTKIAIHRRIIKLAAKLVHTATIVKDKYNKALIKNLALAKEYGYKVDFETMECGEKEEVRQTSIWT